jgi:hypothetical protein
MASGINVNFGASDAGFSSTIRKVNESIKSVDDNARKVSISVASSFASMVKAGAGLAVGMGAIKLALSGASKGFELLKNSIGEAAEIETLTTSFVPLLGSIDKAKARIKELSKFAATTPFELPEIAAASVTLETMTAGALATGKGLTLVGDVASGTNTRFEEVAVTIGRLYDGLQSGRAVGEASNRLQELGALSGEARNKLEDLQKEGMKGEYVWGIAEAALQRFSGGMLLQSRTWNGIMSNFRDAVGRAMAAFGQPIMDSLKPYLDASIVKIESYKEKINEVAQKIGNGITLMMKSFETGMFFAALKLQFIQISNEIYANIVAALEASKSAVIAAFGPESSIYTIVRSAFKIMAAELSLAIGNGLKPILETLPFIGEEIGKSMDVSIKRIGNEIKNESNKIRNVVSEIDEDFVRAGKSFSETFKKSYQKANPLFDLTEDLKKVSKLQDEIDKKAGDLTFNMMDDVKKPKQIIGVPPLLEKTKGKKGNADKVEQEKQSLSDSILQKIREAFRSNQIDPGGRFEKRASDALAKGDFLGASRASDSIFKREQNQNIQDVFGSGRAAGRSLQDIAKEQGIETRGKGSKELRKELDERATADKNRMREMIPGQAGKDKAQMEKANQKEDGNSLLSEIKSLVDAIKTTVNKIEPKLPTAALGA